VLLLGIAKVLFGDPRHAREVVERLHVVRTDARALQHTLEERDRLFEHAGDQRAQTLFLERPDLRALQRLDVGPVEAGHRSGVYRSSGRHRNGLGTQIEQLPSLIAIAS
jgi:hypothetical protein